jgi:Protein of unknown function (DUF1524)
METIAHADAINGTLKWLNLIDNFDWIPPAIQYLHAHQHEPESIAAFLQRLERLAASMYIRRVGINGRIDRYADVLKEIDGGKDMLAAGPSLDLTEEEKDDTKAQLNGEIYLYKPRLFILLRLDHAISAGGATYDHEVITVEHVLPQSPAQRSQWEEEFPVAEREYWTNRLAKLVLLPRRKNSAAQNYDFVTKKQKYLSGGHGTSPFVLTTQVLD